NPTQSNGGLFSGLGNMAALAAAGLGRVGSTIADTASAGAASVVDQGRRAVHAVHGPHPAPAAAEPDTGFGAALSGVAGSVGNVMAAAGGALSSGGKQVANLGYGYTHPEETVAPADIAFSEDEANPTLTSALASVGGAIGEAASGFGAAIGSEYKAGQNAV